MNPLFYFLSGLSVYTNLWRNVANSRAVKPNYKYERIGQREANPLEVQMDIFLIQL